MSSLENSMHRIRFSDAKSLISYLDEVQHEEPTAIFRGQSDAEWRLIPSAWRPGSIVEKRMEDLVSAEIYGEGLSLLMPSELWNEWVKKDAVSPECGEQRLISLTAWLSAEHQIVNEFCGLCDEVALPVPGYKDDRGFHKLHRALSNGAPYREYGSEFAFSQHFDVPTRFLDFSDSSLKSLYFAAAGVNSLDLKSPQSDERCFAVVIAKHKEADVDMDEFLADGDMPIVQKRVLRAEIPRLHAQDGLFLLCNEAANAWFLAHGEWPSLDYVSKNWTFRLVVAPVTIASDVLRRLNRVGVNEIRLKPSYETVASRLRLNKN